MSSYHPDGQRTHFLLVGDQNLFKVLTVKKILQLLKQIKITETLLKRIIKISVPASCNGT